MNKSKKICLIIIAVVFAVVVSVNIFQLNRPTVSERENRTLATFPEFSFTSLAEGAYFKCIDAFVSDTFIGREFLIDVSQKIEHTHSISNIIPQNEESVVFLPTEPIQHDDEDATDNEKADIRDEQKSEIISSEASSENISEYTDETSKKDEPEITVPPEREEVPDRNKQKEELLPESEKNEQTESEAEEETQPEKAEKEPEISPAPMDIQTVEAAESGDAEFLTDGYFIYKDAFYSIPYLVKAQNERYGNAVAKYAELFPNARVSVVIAPLSSAMIDNEKIKKKITDQNAMIDTINSYFPENINAVNIYAVLYEHRSEYLFYKSDHHWTARGAYYAYAEFSRSIGVEPTPITDMEEIILSHSWKGTAYSSSNDERVKDFSDVIYAYIPTKSHTMTIYPKGGEAYTVNSSIRRNYKSYTAFIDGDNPYTIISVPENPSNMKVLVLKDSYGDAFVPYLTEIFSTIIVADPRYVGFNLYELLKDYPLSDIIFMTNIYNPSVKSWVNNVNRIIGQ